MRLYVKLNRSKAQLVATFSVLYAIALPTQALDLGNLLSDVINNGALSTKNLKGIFKSITEVSSGQVKSGAEMSGDYKGKVVLYRTDGCGYCKQEAAYMDEQSIPYIEKDVGDSENAAEYRKLGGSGGVPFTVFGQKTMMGFTAASFDKHYAEFQRALEVESTASAAKGLNPGDELVGKIDGVKVYMQASKSNASLMQLKMQDKVIYMGEERDGLYRVTTPKGEGWVDKLLVKKS
jgi:glutaredoxin